MVNIAILEDEYGLTQEFFRKVLGGNMGVQPPPPPGGESPIVDDAPAKPTAEQIVSPVGLSIPQPQGTGDDLDRRIILRNRIRSRVDEGMTRNFANYKVYYALDLALDTPFQQISPTLVQSLIDRDMSSEKGKKEVMDTLTNWGLTSMIADETDPKTGAKTGKTQLNLPTFVQVMVPLAISYVTARWAAVCNDADIKPFFKYDPAVQRMDFRVKCDAVTSRVDVMDRQFGYFDVFKQAAFKMLHYGVVYQFPQEEWYIEEQLTYATKDDVALEETDRDGKKVTEEDQLFWKTVKAGLRYHHPHPSRTYRDLAHPAVNFLTDTGPTFGGYWRISRYRDVAFKPEYYNVEAVSLSDKNILDINRIFFQTVYGACTLAYPVLTMGGEGVSKLDREKAVSQLYYGKDHLDQGILLTEHFEKINPKRDGLVNPKAKRSGGYDGDVWFRFVVAGTNGTILYAAPFPTCPIQTAGYDADEARTMNQSLTLQVQPFADQIGNVLTQMLLSMRQNLANLVLIDTDQVDKGIIAQIKNMGERFFRTLNVQGFSAEKFRKQNSQPPMAVQNFNFPKANLQEMVMTIQTLINILERLLGVSSQEVSQAATHEQSAKEIVLVEKSSSNRLEFTKGPLERMKEAQKNQIYCHIVTYDSPAFWAEVPCDADVTPEMLRNWGFVLEDLSKKHGGDRTIRVKFDRAKTPIQEWMFASGRDGQDRVNDAQIAMTMTQWLQALLADPMTAQAIGPEQAIMAANVIAQYAGLPVDFRLRSMIKNGQQANPQEAQQLLQAVMQEVTKEFGPVMQKMGQQIQKVGEGLKEVGPAVKDEVGQMAEQIETKIEPVVEQTQKNTAAITQILNVMAHLPKLPTRNPDAANPAQPASEA